MSTSLILAIDEVAENQNGKHIIINEGFAALEQAANASLTIDATANGDIVVTEAQFTRNVLLNVINNTAATTLLVPDIIQVINVAQRLFAVNNGGSFDLVVQSAAMGGGTVTVPAGVVAIIHVNGPILTSITSSTGGGGSSGGLFNFAAFFPGLLPANAEIARYVFTDAATALAQFAGSRGSAGVNPTSTSSFNINLNGSLIGAISVDTTGIFTFTTAAPTIQTFAPGDVLTITSPVTQDATLANVGFTLKGSR